MLCQDRSISALIHLCCLVSDRWRCRPILASKEPKKDRQIVHSTYLSFDDHCTQKTPMVIARSTFFLTSIIIGRGKTSIRLITGKLAYEREAPDVESIWLIIGNYQSLATCSVLPSFREEESCQTDQPRGHLDKMRPVQSICNSHSLSSRALTVLFAERISFKLRPFLRYFYNFIIHTREAWRVNSPPLLRDLR